MEDLDNLLRELQQQRRTLEEMLQATRRELEGRFAAAPAPSPAARKNFLAQLSQSLDKIRQYRNAWARLDPAQKQEHSEITTVLRENQNLIMKILVLEKESEPAAPAGRTETRRPDAAERPQASFLARAYRRNSAG